MVAHRSILKEFYTHTHTHERIIVFLIVGRCVFSAYSDWSAEHDGSWLTSGGWPEVD